MTNIIGRMHEPEAVVFHKGKQWSGPNALGDALDDKPADEECPAEGCSVMLPLGWAQVHHMQDFHPEIVRARLEDAGLVRRER